MPDLRTDLEALRDEWQSHATHKELWYHDAASRLTDLLAKHAKATAAPAAPKEWRGPWKCVRCGKQGPNQWGEMVLETGHHFASDEEPRCTGKLVPYERRKVGS